MARVNDIFQEVAAQVGPLEKEAERARRALELHEQKKKADVQLWLFDSERLRVDIEAAEENFRNSGYDLRIAEEAIENFNAQSAQLFEESQSNKAKAAEVLERIRALTKENYERDSQYQVAENAIANTREKIETANAVIATREEQLKGEEAESARRRATCDELAARLAELEGAHTRKAEQAQELASRALTIAGDIATALADIDQRESEVMDVRVRMQVIENGKRTDSGKHESMTAEIAEYQAIAERLGAEHARKQASVDGYAAQIAEAEGRLAVIDGALGDKQAELVEVLEAEKECKLQSDLARQRIEAFRAMEEHFEGYGNSVRFVMEAYAAGRITNQNGSKCGKIYGPLSKVISVDKAYVTAIEIALGVNLQHIVVEDESVAKAAIYTLKQAQAGRATFFPISSMRGQTPTVEMDDAAECKGYIGVASDLVNCEDKFREIVASLLGRTVVFDNLDNATEMARRTKFRVKAVTLDGQVINAGGSFSGGSVKQRSGILGRAGEIAALDEKLKALALDAESLGKERAALEKEIAALNADRADIDAGKNRRQCRAD